MARFSEIVFLVFATFFSSSSHSENKMVVGVGMKTSDARKLSAFTNSLPKSFDEGWLTTIESEIKFEYKDSAFEFAVDTPYRVNITAEGGEISLIEVQPAIYSDLDVAKKRLSQIENLFNAISSLSKIDRYTKVVNSVNIDDLEKSRFQFNERGVASENVGVWLTNENCVFLNLEAYIGYTQIAKLEWVRDMEHVNYLLSIQIFGRKDLNERFFPEPKPVDDEEKRRVRAGLERLFKDAKKIPNK